MACETSDLTSWHVWKPEVLPDWVVLFSVQLEVLSADMSESLKVWLSGCLISDTTLCWWSEMVWLADLTYPSELSDSRHLRHCKSVQTNCHVADETCCEDLAIGGWSHWSVGGPRFIKNLALDRERLFLWKASEMDWSHCDGDWGGFWAGRCLVVSIIRGFLRLAFIWPSQAIGSTKISCGT